MSVEGGEQMIVGEEKHCYKEEEGRELFSFNIIYSTINKIQGELTRLREGLE